MVDRLNLFTYNYQFGSLFVHKYFEQFRITNLNLFYLCLAGEELFCRKVIVCSRFCLKKVRNYLRNSVLPQGPCVSPGMDIFYLTYLKTNRSREVWRYINIYYTSRSILSPEWRSLLPLFQSKSSQQLLGTQRMKFSKKLL